MTPPSDPTPGGGAQDRRVALDPLFRRARMMNLLHEALLGASAYKDLYRIIVAATVWPTAIDFSRAALFRLDTATNVFRGCGGFGVAGRAAHEALRENIILAHGSFENTILSPAEAGAQRAREEALFAQSEGTVRDPFWHKLATDFQRENIFLERARELNIPVPAPGEEESLVGRLLGGKRSFSLRLEPHEDGGLPAEVRALMPGETLWSVIRTGLGPALLIVSDKHWSDPPSFDELDILQMDWFCAQAAMALEKIEVLTELRRSNENMKVLDQMKSSFLSTISHELRTPLTGIMGFTRLLLGGQLGPMPDKQREILGRVVAGAEKLRDIVNDLIELAEIDSGTAEEVQLTQFDPLALVFEALPKIEERMKTHSVRVEPEIVGTVPMIRADARRLARVLHHLLDNAVKFSREGGLVRVVFETTDDELAIRIIDQGIGIEPERLDKIWKSFYQIDDKLQRSYSGMGIGLAISAKLMEGTGGRIEVKSRTGEGSTFSIIYPVAAA